MELSWKDSIFRQREELAHLLQEPLARVADACAPVWANRVALNEVLLAEFSTIPYCTYMYCVTTDGLQVCDNIGKQGLVKGHYDRDRSQRPYMKEVVPSWGYLLSDAYISLLNHRPSLTALQVIRVGTDVVGYLGADFDLRDLPVTAELYEESGVWRQIKGDPAIRSHVFEQCRVESILDRNLDQALSILEELLTQRGVFQTQIHFSSSQATVWTIDDPYRYRILDSDALIDPDICLVYPSKSYPETAVIAQEAVAHVLEILKALRLADENIYLRTSSLNIFNGMVSLTFSCDGSHYMHADEFLSKSVGFWFGAAAE